MNYHRKRPGNGRKEQDRMNLVYIHTHDSGRYWQPYGAPVCMPETVGRGIVLEVPGPFQ